MRGRLMSHPSTCQWGTRTNRLGPQNPTFLPKNAILIGDWPSDSIRIFFCSFCIEVFDSVCVFQADHSLKVISEVISFPDGGNSMGTKHRQGLSLGAAQVGVPRVVS